MDDANVQLRRIVVVNADDFGLSVGVNRGILEAFEAGTVTSTSIMANAPAVDDAIAIARRTPRLGVGLHYNLTAGRPVLPSREVPSLVDARTGAFPGLSAVIARALAGRLDEGELAAECDAQIERVTRGGLALTHVDSHHHAHAAPPIWAALARGARRAGVRVMRRPVDEIVLRRPHMATAQALFRLAYRIAARRAPPLTHTDWFRGFSLTGATDFAAQLLACLDATAPGTTELMVHPGYADDGLADWVKLTASRERELAALTSSAVRARISRGDLVLRRFDELDV